MREVDLFSKDAIAVAESAGANRQGGADGSRERGVRVRRSALWAAYGDALGWISELTDEAGLRRRTGGARLSEPVGWTRRIGGRSGANVSVPRGCYSDDSQLRLATGRAISAVGFDVEAFAKVELPVWLSYALGGGRATVAAAEHLAKARSAWYVNQFKGWTGAGGNGAAMRIQPHVWAARTPDDATSFLPDVARNSICTHSHPTGLMGAVLHALCVGRAIAYARSPSCDELAELIDEAARLPEIMAGDVEFGYWRGALEQVIGDFANAWEGVVEETRVVVGSVSRITKNATPQERYKYVVSGLKLRAPERRGSGMLTAVAAAALTWCESRPAEAMRIAANEFGTDTDTIATMAGAILGAATDEDPQVDVVDADLFRSEADRLATIAAGGDPPERHRYPDLLHWSAPASRADALVRAKDGSLRVRGLGRVAEEIGSPIRAANNGFLWQWIMMEYGQTLLIKRRANLHSDGGDEVDVHGTPATDNGTLTERAVAPEFDRLKLSEVLSYVKDRVNSDEALGRALRHVVSKRTPGETHEFTGKVIDLLRAATRGGR